MYFYDSTAQFNVDNTTAQMSVFYNSRLPTIIYDIYTVLACVIIT